MKISIHYSIIFLLIFALYADFIDEILVFLLVTFLHEISHMIVAMCCKVKVRRIILTIIGGFIDLEVNDSKVFKNFVISSAGVMMNFLLLFLSRYITSYYYRNIFYRYNMLMIYINLIPIYPLDGFRLFDSIIYGIFRNYFVIKISIVVSFACWGVFTIYSLINQSLGFFIIAIFLLFKNIKLFIRRKNVYLKRTIQECQNKIISQF